MRQLAPYAILFCFTAANAELVNTKASGLSSVDNPKVQQTTQSIASRLVSILALTTVSSTERDSVALKTVVIAALNEGKSMKEVRLATNQAVKEVTGMVLSSEAPNVSELDSSASQPTTAATPPPIGVNPLEVSVDPETGNKMATLLPGESIYRLAQRVYGKENGRKYLDIYAANRDKIKDINVVVEGLVLVMP